MISLCKLLAIQLKRKQKLDMTAAAYFPFLHKNITYKEAVLSFKGLINLLAPEFYI
jgi:hypothetical protein